jgi:hypothetical protein
MESPDQSEQGYPEEAPSGADPAGGRGRRTDKPPPADDAPDHDDGKATGHPHDHD